jgi:hypothetical protein
MLLGLACSAPPGTSDPDEVPEFGGTLTPGASQPGSGLAPAPGTQPGATGATGASPTGAGGSSGSEPTGANVPLQPAQGTNAAASAGAGGAAMVTPPSGTNPGTGGASMTTPVGAGGGSMVPVDPDPGDVDPVPTPPVTPPPVNPPPVTPPPSNPAPSGDCPGQFFCDGFESVADGASPTASLWTIIDGYSERPASDNVQVSADNAHSGGRALRVASSQSRNGIRARLPQTRYFVRAFLMADAVPLGPVFMGLGTGENAEIRLRIQGQSFATINVVPGDAVRPSGANGGGCPGCLTLAANEWFCAEMFVDDATRSATLWIDDAEAAAVVNGDGGWSDQPDAPALFLGSMGLQGGSTGVWIDDVVAGPNRIGCD